MVLIHPSLAVLLRGNDKLKCYGFFFWHNTSLYTDVTCLLIIQHQKGVLNDRSLQLQGRPASELFLGFQTAGCNLLLGSGLGLVWLTVRLNSRDCQHAPIPPNSISHVSKWLTQVSITHLALKQDWRVGYHPYGALLGFRVTFSFIYYAGC